MSEKKWTPGPWVVNPEFIKWARLGDHSESPTAILSDKGKKVLYCSEWLNVEDSDVALMAAAPELYEALFRLTTECVIDGKEGEAGYDCWIHHAKAALAKARGETK